MKWHHSLYWRIAVGFVGCLALLLVVQAVLFVWVASRTTPNIPNQPPERFAQTLALELSRALEIDPSVDLAAHVKSEYAGAAQPFFVLLADGRSIEIGGPFAPQIVDDARARLGNMRNRRPERGRGRPFGVGPFGRGERFGAPALPPPGAGDAFGGVPGPELPGGRPPAPRGERGGPGPFRPAPIFDGDRFVGLVIVPPQPPFSFLLKRYAPTLGPVALVTLIVGAIVAAAAIFGPARRRLRDVEDAARRLGAGDLSARAPARGDDEVAAVAQAFNTMAEDLAARAAALAASDRARRQLLADVSHELNTPITAMRGYLETLNMSGEMGLDDATRARYLAIVTEETARLERIIGDLLDLARVEGGGGHFTIASVSIAGLFDRVAKRHERALAEAAVTLRTEVAPDAQMIEADGDRLEQALQNLAANALRYAPPGTAIELRSRREGAAVLLSVTDAGPGIAPEHLEHLFDRFFKVDQARAHEQSGGAGGSGLGLSIVKAIVERHGGTVTVRSDPGRTTFELRIGN